MLTNDEVLVQTLGGKLKDWGAVVCHDDPGQALAMLGNTIDVILVDVRYHADETLQRLDNIRREMPNVETILINSSDNISASMAGMRAGASDELIVPFDTETLKRAVNAACGRSRKRLKKRTGRSLFDVFGETMSAATFAQAGEFETALDFLNRSATKKNPGKIDGKKKNGPGE